MNISSLNKNNYYYIIRDVGAIITSILIAILIIRTGIIYEFIAYAHDWGYIGSFISGMFFTSAFTTAPAIVALGEFAKSGSVVITALLGACGAVIGDLIIFKFVRHEMDHHIKTMSTAPKKPSRLRQLFKNRWFRWVPFFLGGLILASPLPDELGVGLMGISHANMKTFATVSFLFNFIGILLIGLAAKAI